MSWVPGDGTCCWGAITGNGCAEPTTRIAWMHDVIDADPLPRTGLVAVPVCAEHGEDSRDWQLVLTRQAWLELQEAHPSRVWLVEATSPVR